MHARKTDDFAADHLELWQGVGEAYSLGQTVFGQATGFVVADVGMQDKGPRGAGRCRTVALLPFEQVREIVILVFGQVGNQSSPS
ncbi:hypothetical protein [Rhodobacter amnigenus]|uniref:hypothetical protein n=1 Tax=Paragemmobacter amnigenus TaxID=2852097 RepID=UPI001E51644F|nr:hypothetical protein [Rhodobacter amnigenus]